MVAKGAQSRQGFAVFGAIRSALAGNDVVRMANGESLDLYAPIPRMCKTLDSVGSEDQVHIERAVLQLHEVLAAFDFLRLNLGQREAELAKSMGHTPAVFIRLQREDVNVLRGVRKPQENRGG